MKESNRRVQTGMILALNLIIMMMMMIPAAAASKAAASYATSASKKQMTTKASYLSNAVEKTSPVMAFVPSRTIQRQQQSGLQQQRHGYHDKKYHSNHYLPSKVPSMLRLMNKSMMISSTSYHSSSSMMLSMSSMPTLEQVSLTWSFVLDEFSHNERNISWDDFSH